MLPEFRLLRADSVHHAGALMAEHEDEAAWYCGGTEIVLAMKLGLVDCSVLIDLKGVRELGGLTVDGDVLRLGAAVTHHQLETSARLGELFPALVAMERTIANHRVRRIGTLGGNLAFGEPHSDPAGFLIAAGASLQCWAADGSIRTVPAEQFLQGPFESALRPGELLGRIDVPIPGAGAGMGHERFVLTERPEVTVSTYLRAAAGRVEAARVVVGACGPVPARSAPAEQLLLGAEVATLDERTLRTVGRIAADSATLDGEDHLAEAYRRQLVAVLTARSLRTALAAVGPSAEAGPQ